MIAEEAGGIYRTTVDTDGNLYVAFHDANFSSDISVKKWNGSDWEFVGSPGFGVYATSAYPMQISCLSDNAVVLAYPKAETWNEGFGDLEVLRYNGTSWENMGQNIAGDAVSYISMGVLSSDDIYLNYLTANDESRIAKFSGTDWNVLTTPFDEDSIYTTNIVVGANDEIIGWRSSFNSFGSQFYIAFDDVWSPINSPNDLIDQFIVVNQFNWAIEFNGDENSWYAGFTTNTNSISYFKKFDGANWISECDSVDTSNGTFYYSDLEFDSEGTPYYTNAMGNLSTCNNESVGISDDEDFLDFTIYPNPGTELIIVQFNKPQSNVRIYNLTGKELFSRTLNNGDKIDLRSFKKGLYLIQSEGITKRLVIQ
ncbi:MAG TPA: T9SS type A sorting domain-containing protein [Membranihabitans sp.]|nr:T9SS type A sorting domain-containing protein [Membranihabitans sp.]